MTRLDEDKEQHHVGRRPGRALASLCVTPALLAALVLASPPALAEPTTPDPAAADAAADIEQVRLQVDAFRLEASHAGERYNDIQVALETAGERLEAARFRETDQGQVVDELRTTMGRLASEVYRDGGVDPSLRFVLSEDPLEFLLNSARVDRVSANQAVALERLREAEQQLAADRVAVAEQAAEMSAAKEQLAVERRTVEERLAAAQVELDRLTEAERLRVERARQLAEEQAMARAAEQAEQEAREQAAQEAQRPARVGRGSSPSEGDGEERGSQAASRSSSRSPLSGGNGSSPAAASTSAGSSVATTCAGITVQAPDARVRAVIDFACAQLGKPYRWGATGPGSYDCSGFTMAAWRQGGVNLPHSSRAQYGSGTRVSRSDLRPGDLVFSYQPISHVGIYLGGGRMIASPSSGDVVKISPMGYIPYTGAVRP